MSVAIYNTWCFFSSPLPVTGMKMEAIPELRMETEDRQSTEYEVHHQKLVNKRAQTQTLAQKVAEAAARMIYFSRHRHVERCIRCHALARAHVSTHRVGSTSWLSPPGEIPRLSPWRQVSMETAAIMRASCFVCRTPTRVKFCLSRSVFPGLAPTIMRL